MPPYLITCFMLCALFLMEQVCLESPSSVKANMYQTLSSRETATISRTDFDYGDVVQWQQLVSRLCLFHSLANARRAYGSEGWRVPYVFGPNDLKVHTYAAYAGLSVVPILLTIAYGSGKCHMYLDPYCSILTNDENPCMHF